MYLISKSNLTKKNMLEVLEKELQDLKETRPDIYYRFEKVDENKRAIAKMTKSEIFETFFGLYHPFDNENPKMYGIKKYCLFEYFGLYK